MKLNYKRVNQNAKEPVYSTEEAACFDLFCSEINRKTQYIEYKIGIAFEIPIGYLGIITARSSITNKDLICKNGIGIIDPDYRGEVTFRCLNLNGDEKYKIGDRCAQMTLIKNTKCNLNEVSLLSETKRGKNGYGHTGDK